MFLFMSNVVWANDSCFTKEDFLKITHEALLVEIYLGAARTIVERNRAIVLADCLHWSRRFEYPWALIAGNIQKTDRVLDAGAGSASFQYLAARRADSVVSLDARSDDRHVIENANRIGLRNIHPVSANILNMPFRNNYFDKVFCLSTLEHEVDVERSLSELLRVVAPGGFIILTLDISDHKWHDFNIDLKRAESLLMPWISVLPKFPTNGLTIEIAPPRDDDPSPIRLNCLCVKIVKL